MRLVIEVTNDVFNAGRHVSDNNVIGIATRVWLNDERQYSIERMMSEDEMRSRFDIIWEEMGIQIKAGMKEPVPV